MRIIMLLSMLGMYLFAGKPVALVDAFATSEKCVSCHSHIVKEWQGSWHAQSHYTKDEYFKKTIDYMARKMRGKSEESLKVECATCHNPRISITKTSIDDEIANVMGLESDLHEATENEALQEGINCAVCHNINKIHHNKDPKVRGINLVEWMKAGKMSGPYADARSPYHMTEQRTFMSSDPNRLCFVCHANNRSVDGHIFSNTQEEYSKHKDAKACVDCHMSEKEEGVASTFPVEDGKPKARLVRKHGFEGAHSPRLIKGALELSLQNDSGKLGIELYNPNPHNVPTGYGGREIIVDVQFFSLEGVVSQSSLSLTSAFLNKRKKKSVPHCATEITENRFVPARGKKEYSVVIPKGARNAEVKVYFRLVNEDIVEILDLKDEVWSKKMLIVKKTIKV